MIIARNQSGQAIPVQLPLLQFRQFILPYLVAPDRGSTPKISSFKIFNYILTILYLGSPWKMIPIDKGPDGRPEIHYTRVYAAYRRWLALGCFDAIFTAGVSLLHQCGIFDLTVIHGDGTTTAAKKGGDNIKGDKVVAFCDRDCNVIAPFVTASGNQNESPLFREALPRLTSLAKTLGSDLHGSVISLDGAYGCRAKRKAIFNRGIIPNINEKALLQSSR